MENNPPLTPELLERIRQNRERALEIQRKRRLEREQQQQQQQQQQLEQQKQSEAKELSSPRPLQTPHGRAPPKTNTKNSASSRKRKSPNVVEAPTSDPKNDRPTHDSDDDILEDFEVGASPYVSKQEAMKMYCLPASTLAVCTIAAERPNPHQASWTRMKLYDRAEIRRRARQRHGGLAGLQAVRQARAQQALDRDLQDVRRLF